MANALKFRQTNIPRQAGEQARLKVVQGPDYGSVYVLTSARGTIGRGEENDVVISDLKSSRVHAEVILTPAGWQIRDLGSSNGILVNGKATTSVFVKSKDTFSLGETTFEFMASESSTRMLAAPPPSIHQLKSDGKAVAEQKQKVRSLAELGANFGLPKGLLSASSINASGASKRTMILGAVVLVVGLMFFGDDSKQKKPVKKASVQDAVRDLASYLPTSDVTINKTADTMFKAGFREYRNGNYLRAKREFENILQISPGHRLATLYLENSNKAIVEEVKFHLDNGKKSLDAGKLKEAKAHFEAVERLLVRDQSNPNFAEAKDDLERVNKAMSKDGGTG